jgi:hypothetical protein
MSTLEEYQSTIGDKLKDLDVAMLFLNAGAFKFGDFSKLPPQEIE